MARLMFFHTRLMFAGLQGKIELIDREIRLLNLHQHRKGLSKGHQEVGSDDYHKINHSQSKIQKRVKRLEKVKAKYLKKLSEQKKKES